MQGKFITFEGPDGAGKTTQIKLLAKLLEADGREVILTREPGGTPLSEKIRALLLSEPMQPSTEMLLFAASRAEHLETLILPAMAEGKFVLCDRFTDSTYAYQGGGRGYPEKVLQLEKFVCGKFEPDYTLFFDITLEESAKRIASRGGADRFDAEKEQFRKDTYQGFLDRLRTETHRMYRVNAMRPVEEVSASVAYWYERIMKPELLEKSR